MADVAREAGVSLMTVSRAVNNKDGISEGTRQRIQEIIDRLGYRPSIIARSLVTDRTGTIGLIVIDNSNPFFSEIARGVEHEAYATGYNVFLCNTEEDTQRELAVLRSLEEKRVDGIILCSSRLPEDDLLVALEPHPAVVLVNRKLTQKHYLSILLNDEGGARRATEHLLQHGHRNIGLLAGPPRSYGGQQRMKGYRDALESAGICPKPEWTRHCLPIVDSGREAAADLLLSCPDISALFCFNDLNAVGALQACQSLGRRVPDDVAVTGFDDIPMAALVTPALTTCRTPTYEVGQQAMSLLLECINGCEGECEDIIFERELVIRESAP
ncbi:MAG: LacI family DNA-binding transcriptional regulator [Chloroflexi bacterium]|nr:LacI family DNA-binding transcriptional regulator [Chloroflexota bacterium]